MSLVTHSRPVEISNHKVSHPADISLSDLAGKLDQLIESYCAGNVTSPKTTLNTSEVTPNPVDRNPDVESTVPTAMATAPTPATLNPHSPVGIADHTRSTIEMPPVADAPVKNPQVQSGPGQNSPEVSSAASFPTSPLPNPAGSNTCAEVASEVVSCSVVRWDELRNSRIMIVDDEEVNILTVKHHLKREGLENVITTTAPREAMELLRTKQPDVILLDVKMPQVSGIDILRAKSVDRSLDHIPVIVLTAATDPVTKRQALELGANDFLTKPVDPNDLLPRVRNALVVKRHFDQLANQASRLEEIVKRRTSELFQSRQQLILSLARAAEHRDNETGNHVVRVGRYAGIVARELGWSDEQVEILEQAAQLHDVGKIGIPDAILFKPGKLDPAEFDIIKRHCAVGKGIIEPMSERDFQVLKTHARVGENILHVRNSPLLMMASRIAQTHHENWDGTGYPLGLAHEDIPLEGRITAVADVFDALSSRRPYKEPFPREKCFQMMEELRGKKFDPRVLDAFFRSSTEITNVQISLMDGETGCPQMFAYYADKAAEPK